jgi:hypothetical protein
MIPIGSCGETSKLGTAQLFIVMEYGLDKAVPAVTDTKVVDKVKSGIPSEGTVGHSAISLGAPLSVKGIVVTA